MRKLVLVSILLILVTSPVFAVPKNKTIAGHNGQQIAIYFSNRMCPVKVIIKGKNQDGITKTYDSSVRGGLEYQDWGNHQAAPCLAYIPNWWWKGGVQVWITMLYENTNVGTYTIYKTPDVPTSSSGDYHSLLVTLSNWDPR